MSKKTDKTLNKCEELIDRLNELKKALSAPNVQSSRKPVNALGAGWSQDAGTGAFHHSSHGIIGTTKHPDGYYQITHGGRPVGRAASMGEAGAKIKNYIGSLGAGDTGMHNMNPMAAKSDDEGMDKSNYGKFKGGSQYSAADNAKRKQGNTNDKVMNQNVKSYTGRAMAHKEPSGAAGPAKKFSPEQIAAINEARKLKKNSEEQPWDRHARVPNADAELTKVQVTNPVNRAEALMPNQLANLMAGRAMLGIKPPPQPTNEQMFGHLVPSEEEIQKAESAWSNRMNWLEEAMKPIASRFNSPEEEEQYWASIKVTDRDDGKPGY